MGFIIRSATRWLTVHTNSHFHPLALTLAGNTVSSIIIKTEGWQRPRRTICLRVQSSSRPLQVSIQWDGRGQDTINSRCTGGCAARPCINIDSLCIPALHYLWGIDAKRRECIWGCFLACEDSNWMEKARWKCRRVFFAEETIHCIKVKDRRQDSRCLFILLARSSDAFSKLWKVFVLLLEFRWRWKHLDEDSLEGSPAPAGSAATAGGTNQRWTLLKSPSWACEELIAADCADFCRNRFILHERQH